VYLFGEGYGGKCQGMRNTYGEQLRFVAFDVKVNNRWQTVPRAEEITKQLGLDFVDYVRISTDLDAINFERDRPSVQAIKNGVGDKCKREGVVLRPLAEFVKDFGERIICKHKAEAFSERKTTPKVPKNVEELQAISNAIAIAEEWVTPMRLQHVLDKIPQDQVRDMALIPYVCKAMVEDVFREARGEIVESKAVQKEISQKTISLYKAYLFE